MTAPSEDREIYGPHALKLSRGTRTFFVVLAALGLASVGFGLAGQLADSNQRRSDELRSCSSSFSAELVTGPTASALKALAQQGADSPEFQRAVDQANPERFIVLAKMSRTDPAKFLRICHRADS